MTKAQIIDMLGLAFERRQIRILNDPILIGELPDQSALYGLLESLRDLGMSLVSVRRVDHTVENE